MDTGTVINGFRIERLLGRGSLGAVYEATQLSLGRTVALRLLDQSSFSDRGFSARFREQQRLSAALHHPHVVPTYEAGDWPRGKFVATRFVSGRTLADLIQDGALSPSRSRQLLAQLTDALDAAHDAGLVHGRVSSQNVLVDAEENAYLADLGLGRSGSVSADRSALSALESQAEQGPRPSRIRSFAAPALAGMAAIGAAAAVLTGNESGRDRDSERPPPVTAGAVPLGSELATGSAQSVGCSAEPGPNTPACTMSQSSAEGQSMTVREAGVIRAWAVRGAAGDLALQVISRRDGHAFVRGFSQTERVPDLAPHAFAANVRVARGDSIGVLLSPGAAVGARAASDGTSALRWEGSLEVTPRSPRPQSAVRLDQELLLRADIEFGARPDQPPQLTGSSAATADTGRPLEALVIDSPGGRAIRVELVRVTEGVAIDAFRGPRRLARIAVPDASPGGRLIYLEGQCGYRLGFCLRWLNEGETTPLMHSYRIARGGGSFRLIG